MGRKNITEIAGVISTQEMIGSVIRGPDGKVIYNGVEEAIKRKEKKEKENA